MKLYAYVLLCFACAAAFVTVAPAQTILTLPSQLTLNGPTVCPGGPPNYCANSTQNIITETPMDPPPVNSPFDDPDFNSRMVRVTDANTLSDYAGGYYTGIDFVTASSAEANTWGKFDPSLGGSGGYRFVVIGTGGAIVPFVLDATTMNVTRLTGQPGSFLNTSGYIDLSGVSFSYTNPDLLYGMQGTQLMSYDLSNDSETLVYDFAQCPGLPAYVSQPSLYTGDVTNSNDDTKFSLAFGGAAQDQTTLAVYYDSSANNGAGACYWYDTETGMVGGTNMDATPIASQAGSYNVHNVRMSRDGAYVRVDPAQGQTNYFWQPGTNQDGTCIAVTNDCSGHLAMGYTHLIDDADDYGMADVVIRPFSDLTTHTELVTPQPTPAQFDQGSHWSWNDDDPSDSMPVCGSFYQADVVGDGTQNVLTNPLLAITGVYDGEIACVATTGPSKVWRFAHDRSGAAYNDSPSSAFSFWATPRGNVSQDGKFYMFTSNWDWSLGDSRDSSGGCPSTGECRMDVFIVELR